jgi:hypothetical protein
MAPALATVAAFAAAHWIPVAPGEYSTIRKAGQYGVAAVAAVAVWVVYGIAMWSRWV